MHVVTGLRLCLSHPLQTSSQEVLKGSGAGFEECTKGAALMDDR